MRDINHKIIGNDAIMRCICEDSKEKNEKIVLTTGAYDILHEGHLKYLINSKKLGDILIVGINDDLFVKNLKGGNRPINKQDLRAFMIAGFECVDFVYIFNDRLQIVDLIRPDIFVMSNSSHTKPEKRTAQQEIVKRHGGEIIIFDKMSNVHTTSLINKMATN